MSFQGVSTAGKRTSGPLGLPDVGGQASVQQHDEDAPRGPLVAIARSGCGRVTVASQRPYG